MVWGLVAIVAIIWVGRKMRPAHLGDDILKFELFRHLRFKNSVDAVQNMTYEDLEKRQWLRFLVMTLFVSGSTFLSLAVSLGFTTIASSMTSFVVGTIWAVSYLRFTRTFRQITLPLYATLCRIPQTRWNILARPSLWVRVNLKKGKVWIRLPKDWHASPIQLKAVRELVNARIAGTWVMESNTQRFLLTLTRETDAETVLVTGNEESQEAETLEFEYAEKEPDDSPW